MQLVALVRTLQLVPTILLLDEPTAALDPSTAAAVVQLIEQWRDELPEERAYVWVTHNHPHAHLVADRTWRVANGRVTEVPQKDSWRE